MDFTEEEKVEVLNDFISKIIDESKDIDPEIYDVVNKNYFDLL